MDVRPLRRYARPVYPTHDILDAHPELLRLTPNRWQRGAILLTAAALGSMLTQGCVNRYGMSRSLTTGTEEAPHPYFPENEAIYTITQEAKRGHLRFNTSAPETRIVELQYPYPNGSVMKETCNITLDGIDSAHHLRLVYLDDDELSTLAGNTYCINKLMQTPAGVASVVREIQRAVTATDPDNTCAVFYEPRGDTKDEEREKLRLQVRDYVSWLKGQGVL